MMKLNRFIYVTERKHITTHFYSTNTSQYCYVPIFKNAHTWGADFFHKYANFTLTENFKDKKYIIFLRDPIKRWFSGVAQWLELNHKGRPDIVLDPLLIKAICAGLELDVHTKPQVDFLLGLPREDCIFFDLEDENFEFNLKFFIRKYMNVTTPKVPTDKRNVSERSKFKSNVINQIKTYIEENPSVKQHLEIHYSKDMVLYKNSSFYTQTI